jgi:hypothetical protein
MANVLKGEVPLNLSDGRRFTLVADFEATIEAESLYGKPAPQMAQDASAGFIGAIRALLYGMLKRKHPEATPSLAAELIAEHMDEVAAALEAASAAAAPDAAEGKKGGNPRPARRGKTSGDSGAKPA